MDTYDLQINQGETYALTLSLKDASGSAINLGTSLVSGYLKFKYSDLTKLVDLNPTISNAVSGIITLNLSAASTAALPITLAVYDIEVNNTGTSVVTKALGGKAYIYPEVTF